MRKSVIKAKLRRGRPALVVTLHLQDASLYELTSLMGFDGIWVDMEHHGLSIQTAQHFMRAARVGRTDILARPAKGEMMRMGRMLESGAHGILYPRCDNAEEAAEVVKWAKFPPEGCRGIDSGNPDTPYCTMTLDEYLPEANRETFIAIQIEDAAALEHADEIAAVDGVDLLFLGPGDFSALSGIPGQMDHELIRDATRRVAEAAKKAGKTWGRPVASVAQAQEMLDLGAGFLACGADLLMVKTGLEKLQDDFAPLGFTFDNQVK